MRFSSIGDLSQEASPPSSGGMPERGLPERGLPPGPAPGDLAGADVAQLYTTLVPDAHRLSGDTVLMWSGVECVMDAPTAAGLLWRVSG